MERALQLFISAN